MLLLQDAACTHTHPLTPLIFHTPEGMNDHFTARRKRESNLPQSEFNATSHASHSDKFLDKQVSGLVLFGTQPGSHVEVRINTLA